MCGARLGMLANLQRLASILFMCSTVHCVTYKKIDANVEYGKFVKISCYTKYSQYKDSIIPL